MREIPRNYEYERLEDTFVTGVVCYKVRAQSNSEEDASAYIYRDLYIARDSFHLLQIDFYGPGEKLMKVLNAYDYESAKVKGATVRPHRAVMQDFDKDSSTIFTVIEGRIDEEIDADLLTPAKIEK